MSVVNVMIWPGLDRSIPNSITSKRLERSGESFIIIFPAISQLPPMGHDRHIPPGTFSHPRILAAGATIIDLFGLLFPLGTEIIS